MVKGKFIPCRGRGMPCQDHSVLHPSKQIGIVSGCQIKFFQGIISVVGLHSLQDIKTFYISPMDDDTPPSVHGDLMETGHFPDTGRPPDHLPQGDSPLLNQVSKGPIVIKIRTDPTERLTGGQGVFRVVHIQACLS